nr:MAG TPA: hypothetical protein [Caudoviricetes sp.]
MVIFAIKLATIETIITVNVSCLRAKRNNLSIIK